MKRYSYRDSMGYATSVENFLMNSDPDDLNLTTDPGQIFHTLSNDRELMTVDQINAMLNNPDAHHNNFECVEYTVESIRNLIREYKRVRKQGGRFAGSTYFASPQES